MSGFFQTADCPPETGYKCVTQFMRLWWIIDLVIVVFSLLLVGLTIFKVWHEAAYVALALSWLTLTIQMIMTGAYFSKGFKFPPNEETAA